MQRSVSGNPLPDIPQHPPAQKIAGRRMSATKPRPHIINDHKAPSAPSEDDDADAEPVDYPRPAAPGTAEPHPHTYEEEQLHKDKKQGSLEHERKPKEDLYRKAEANRPSKDIPVNKAAGGGRINQPQGKVGI